MPNAHLFARALYALHEAGVLAHPSCKPAVKLFIRQASEDKHWNLSTHYRSKRAAAKINAAAVRTEAAYHRFCRQKENGLTHEHMVPGEVVYQLIISHPHPSVQEFASLLERTGYRATITQDEDRKLSRSTVPASFFEPNSKMFFNHLARYVEAEIHVELEPRPKLGWFEREV